MSTSVRKHGQLRGAESARGHGELLAAHGGGAVAGASPRRLDQRAGASKRCTRSDSGCAGCSAMKRRASWRAWPLAPA
jgi:hypothetical protein